MEHIVRDKFRSDEVAGTGKAVEVAIHLDRVKKRGLVRLTELAEKEIVEPVAAENDSVDSAGIEGKIETNFSGAKKEFIADSLERYPKDLQKAKEKRKNIGADIGDKWAASSGKAI